MQRRAKRRTSARMDQWTRSLSKVAPQSRICVKTWTLPYSGQAFDRLYRPTAGQDMRHQRGHFQWQTTLFIRYHELDSGPICHDERLSSIAILDRDGDVARTSHIDKRLPLICCR